MIDDISCLPVCGATMPPVFERAYRFLLCLDLQVSSLGNEVFLVQPSVPCGDAEELLAVEN